MNKRIILPILIFVCLGLTSAAATPTVQKPVADTQAAPAPEMAAQPVVMRFDDGITITWNVPVVGFTYRLPEGMQSRLYMNADGRSGVIRIVNYEQGQTFNLEITGALGANGRSLRPGTYVQTIETPLALKVDVTPAPGQNRVPNMSEIIFTFGEEVSNPDALEKSFSINPPTAGLLTWVTTNQAKFTPKAKWAYDTAVRVVLKGGTGSLAGMNGNYVDRDVVDEFTTMPQKMIDLNLSDQKLYCYDEGNLVFSCWIASGKSGYSTRTGDFRIYDKNQFVDMQSSPGDAEPYLVKDVPYVNWFSGGQAIHGCYWSSEFGYPRSHGCVNVTVSDAEWIYNWSTVGTPVFSHY